MGDKDFLSSKIVLVNQVRGWMEYNVEWWTQALVGVVNTDFNLLMANH